MVELSEDIVLQWKAKCPVLHYPFHLQVYTRTRNQSVVEDELQWKMKISVMDQKIPIYFLYCDIASSTSPIHTTGSREIEHETNKMR